MVADVCVVVLCGLPASGKTSLCSAVKEQWKFSFKDKHPHVVHVCFDDLIPPDLELKYDRKMSGVEESVDSGNALHQRTWKSYRKYVLMCFEKLLNSLKNDKIFCCEINDSTDRLLTEMWERMWNSFITPQKGCSCFINEMPVLKLKQTEFRWDKSAPHIFIIDDNMYYRSMRYEYFQLARKYIVGFSQVFLSCPLEVAQRRNSSRQRPEKDLTLVNMSNQIEAPASETFPWEQHSTTIDTSTIFLTEENRARLNNLIRNSMADPPEPLPEEDMEEKEASRQACAASTIHQADQIIRKLITNIMEQEKGKHMFCKRDLQALGKELNQHRKQFLDQLKLFGLEALSEDVNVTNHLITELPGDETCETHGVKSNSEQTENKECECKQLYAALTASKSEYFELIKPIQQRSKAASACKCILQKQTKPQCILTDGAKRNFSTKPTSCIINVLVEFSTVKSKDKCLNEKGTRTPLKSHSTSGVEEPSDSDVFLQSVHNTFVSFCINKSPGC